MTAGFDWSGAPEGERWVARTGSDTDTQYVLNGDVAYALLTHGWGQCAPTAATWCRKNGIRVESARPAPRVGDRVRVTIEGTVAEVDLDGFAVRDDHDLFRYFMFGQGDVEVLQRADPPLQPGDLVRDGDGMVWQLVSLGRFTKVFMEDGFASWSTSLVTRDKLNGPLVKVQLTEVPDA